MRLLVLRGEAAVPVARLSELERIEVAHAAYLSATQAMRLRHRQMQDATGEYAAGWHSCLREFCELVVRP